jgi:hypothetical protein
MAGRYNLCVREGEREEEQGGEREREGERERVCARKAREAYKTNGAVESLNLKPEA